MHGRSSFFIAALLTVMSFTGCRKEPETRFEKINGWIYGEMDFWYFWTDQMAEKPGRNTDPETFFEELLYQGDRFSFIYDDYEELLNLLKGVSLESGFEFKLYRESEGSESIFIQLVYVKEASPADGLGLQRGDQLYQINNVQLTASNYPELLGEMNELYTASYRRYNQESGEFETGSPVTIQPVSYAEHPILLDTIYEIEGKKLGYFIYTFFASGPNSESAQYDAEMDAAFGRFKAAGIEELIVDLRFNNGGSIVSAENLASLLVKNASPGDLMFRKSYNDQVEDEILREPDGEEFLNIPFQAEPNNLGQTISSNTIYFITSGRTASASEVVINALKPYMDVFIIGETTVGKDVGSVTLYDEERSGNWAIQPIVVKLVNSAGEDYPNGFSPDVPLPDNFLVLEPLGAVDEPLFNAALGAIGVQPARVDFSRYRLSQPLRNSLDTKVRSGVLVME